MSPTQKHRLVGSLLLIIASIAAAYLVIIALRENVHFFFNPLEVAEAKAAIGTRIRVGGMVQQGSLMRKEGLTVEFLICDAKNVEGAKHAIKVQYTGLLPDLFREGQSIVVSGILQSPTFLMAEEVLAKHDENYKPKA